MNREEDRACPVLFFSSLKPLFQLFIMYLKDRTKSPL